MNAYETPLVELLKTVPKDARFVEEEEFSSTYHPVGRLCHEAADRIAELEKDLALKTRDRDVFRDFTLAYEKRIEELEKVIQEGIKAFGEIQDQRLKDKFETPQTKPAHDFNTLTLDTGEKRSLKPLSDEEIGQIWKDCMESQYMQVSNPVGFARAIEERHGIK